MEQLQTESKLMLVRNMVDYEFTTPVNDSLSSLCMKVFNQEKVETIEPRFLSYRAPYKEISLPNNLLRYIPAESVTRHIIRLDLRFNQITTFYPEDIVRGRQILFIGLYSAV